METSWKDNDLNARVLSLAVYRAVGDLELVPQPQAQWKSDGVGE